MAHDSRCEALTFLGILSTGKIKLLTREDLQKVIEEMRVRGEEQTSGVPMDERICGCGVRNLISLDKISKDQRMELMGTWGDNLGLLLARVLPNKREELLKKVEREERKGGKRVRKRGKR